jgi:hypothetical protein
MSLNRVIQQMRELHAFDARYSMLQRRAKLPAHLFHIANQICPYSESQYNSHLKKWGIFKYKRSARSYPKTLAEVEAHVFSDAWSDIEDDHADRPKKRQRSSLGKMSPLGLFGTDEPITTVNMKTTNQPPERTVTAPKSKESDQLSALLPDPKQLWSTISSDTLQEVAEFFRCLGFSDESFRLNSEIWRRTRELTPSTRRTHAFIRYICTAPCGSAVEIPADLVVAGLEQSESFRVLNLLWYLLRDNNGLHISGNSPESRLRFRDSDFGNLMYQLRSHDWKLKLILFRNLCTALVRLDRVADSIALQKYLLIQVPGPFKLQGGAMQNRSLRQYLLWCRYMLENTKRVPELGGESFHPLPTTDYSLRMSLFCFLWAGWHTRKDSRERLPEAVDSLSLPTTRVLKILSTLIIDCTRTKLRVGSSCLQQRAQLGVQHLLELSDKPLARMFLENVCRIETTVSALRLQVAKLIIQNVLKVKFPGAEQVKFNVDEEYYALLTASSVELPAAQAVGGSKPPHMDRSTEPSLRSSDECSVTRGVGGLELPYLDPFKPVTQNILGVDLPELVNGDEGNHNLVTALNVEFAVTRAASSPKLPYGDPPMAPSLGSKDSSYGAFLRSHRAIARKNESGHAESYPCLGSPKARSPLADDGIGNLSERFAQLSTPSGSPGFGSSDSSYSAFHHFLHPRGRETYPPSPSRYTSSSDFGQDSGGR